MSKTRTTDTVYTEVLVNEGATWGNSEVPATGFMVSVKGYEYRTDVYSFGPDVLDAYEAVTELPANTYYGAWIDGDDVYLDVSVWVETLDEALLIADLEDQLAVFDLVENDSIKTGR